MVAVVKRFYVTMTWDDWPEGGSYGTILEADDAMQAEEKTKAEMAGVRAEGFTEGEEEASFDYWLENYGNEWCLVDCFDLDEFIERNKRKEPQS